MTRDVKIQEAVVTLLTQQLEQARIDEAKDIPAVQVLDPAVAAERPSRPRLSNAVLVAAVSSLFVGLVLSFTVDYSRRLWDRRKPA